VKYYTTKILCCSKCSLKQLAFINVQMQCCKLESYKSINCCFAVCMNIFCICVEKLKHFQWNTSTRIDHLMLWTNHKWYSGAWRSILSVVECTACRRWSSVGFSVVPAVTSSCYCWSLAWDGRRPPEESGGFRRALRQSDNRWTNKGPTDNWRYAAGATCRDLLVQHCSSWIEMLTPDCNTLAVTGSSNIMC